MLCCVVLCCVMLCYIILYYIILYYIILYYYLVEPLSYMRSVVDRNVVMRRIPVIISSLISHIPVGAGHRQRVASDNAFGTADPYLSPGIS